MACFGNAYNGGFPSYNFRGWYIFDIVAFHFLLQILTKSELAGKEDEEQESLIYPCSASVHMDDPTEAKAEMASLKG